MRLWNPQTNQLGLSKGLKFNEKFSYYRQKLTLGFSLNQPDNKNENRKEEISYELVDTMDHLFYYYPL